MCVQLNVQYLTFDRGTYFFTESLKYTCSKNRLLFLSGRRGYLIKRQKTESLQSQIRIFNKMVCNYD